MDLELSAVAVKPTSDIEYLQEIFDRHAQALTDLAEHVKFLYERLTDLEERLGGRDTNLRN